MKANRNVFILSILLFGIFGSSVYFVYFFSSKVDQQIKYVDVAGRQRMLSQKIAYFSSTKDDIENRADELHALIQMHDSTLNVFLDGGYVMGFDFKLEATEDEQIRSFIQSELMPLWDQFKFDVLTGDVSRFYGKAEQILALNHDLVKQYRKHSDDYKSRFNGIIFTLLIFNLLISVFIVYLAYQFLKERMALNDANKELVQMKDDALERNLELNEKNNELITSEEELKAQQEEMQVILEDIEEKQMALIYEKQRSDSMQAVAKVGFWEIELPFMKYTFTKVVSDLYGLKEGEKIDLETAISYYPEEVQSQIKEALDSAIQTKEEFDLTLPFQKSNKEEVWVRSVCHVDEDFDGNVVRLFGTFQDVTDQKKKDEIVLKNKELERSIAFKSDFLAQMSHEIRTPLNGIIGSLETISSCSEEKKKELMDVMKDSSFELLHIVNNVLKLSKLEAGEEMVTNQDFDLPKLGNDVVQLFYSKANEKGIDLFLEVGGDVPKVVHADAIRLRQVLNNLVSNAIKFTNEGSVKVSLDSKQKGELLVEVIDSGIGIKQEELDKVFSKYVQSKDIESGKKDGQLRGTGLGLAISNMLVKLMGGDEIVVTSEYGKGSRFQFTIPVKVVSMDFVPDGAKERKDVKKLDLEILLVEDIKANQIVAKMMLQSLGCKVSVANNGQEAIDEYGKDPDRYQMILMDIQMPVMDGLQATKELKKQYGDQLCPVIAVSANAMEGDPEKYMSFGMDDYIAKPITKDRVLEKLNVWSA